MAPERRPWEWTSSHSAQPNMRLTRAVPLLKIRGAASPTLAAGIRWAHLSFLRLFAIARGKTSASIPSTRNRSVPAHPASKRSPRQEPPRQPASLGPCRSSVRIAPSRGTESVIPAMRHCVPPASPLRELHHFRNLPSEHVPRPCAYLVKVRPGLLSLQSEDIFQTLATRDSFDPTGARLMSIHPLAG